MNRISVGVLSLLSLQNLLERENNFSCSIALLELLFRHRCIRPVFLFRQRTCPSLVCRFWLRRPYLSFWNGRLATVSVSHLSWCWRQLSTGIFPVSSICGSRCSSARLTLLTKPRLFFHFLSEAYSSPGSPLSLKMTRVYWKIDGVWLDWSRLLSPLNRGSGGRFSSVKTDQLIGFSSICIRCRWISIAPLLFRRRKCVGRVLTRVHWLQGSRTRGGLTRQLPLRVSPMGLWSIVLM